MDSFLTRDNQTSDHHLLAKDSLSAMILKLQDKIILLKSDLLNDSLDDKSILAIFEEINQCNITINLVKSVLKDQNNL
jgi:hypothetical protein